MGKNFFNETIKILKERAIYNAKVWQYAFYHKESDELMAECLKLNSAHYFFADLGTHFTSKLITIDEKNAKRGFTQYLEYHPMVNTRTHQIGKEGTHSILNKTFSETYNQFLSTIV